MNTQVAASTLEDPETLASADVFVQHRDRIYRYLLRVVRNAADAEDLTQETFLRAHRQLESLRDPAALSTWLYRIATHVAYDRFRRSPSHAEARQPDTSADGAPSEAEWTDTEAPRVDEAFEKTEMSACVQELVETLPDTYRAVLLLHDVHGLTNPEIARMLGCSVETVKIRLHRARTKLNAALRAGCDFAQDRRGVLVCERRPGGS